MKFVRVGYKASLLTDAAHSTFVKGEQSDVGIQTKQQSWELLQPTKGTFVNRLVVAHYTLWLVWFCVNSYLVDPASSHMLVSKIKPCMSKYKQICTVKLRMAH